MADFNCPEMASVDGSRRFNATKYYIAVGGAVGRKRSARRRGLRIGVACALVLTTGSLLMSIACVWSQRKLEAENAWLREDVEILETKILTVEEKLSEVRIQSINDVTQLVRLVVNVIIKLYSASSREGQSSRPDDRSDRTE